MPSYSKSKVDNDFLTLKQLGEKIKTDDSVKLFLIVGEEDFFIDLSVKSIKDRYLSAGAESMDYVKLDFNGKSIDCDKVSENLNIPPWLSTKRIVLVDNCTFDSKDQDKTESLLSSIPSGNILIFTLKEFDKRKKKLFAAFKNNGVIAKIDYLDEDTLISWITRKLGKESITITTSACQSLISRCERSMRNVAGECNKLILYCNGIKENSVDDQTVELVCPPDMQGNIFKIMDCVGEGNAAMALIGVNNLINLKEPPIRIRFMLARHFKQLLCAKDLNDSRELSSRMHLMDFQSQKLIKQSRRFSMERLLYLYSECARIDTDIKQGLADDRQSLESFIIMASER